MQVPCGARFPSCGSASLSLSLRMIIWVSATRDLECAVLSLSVSQSGEKERGRH